MCSPGKFFDSVFSTGGNGAGGTAGSGPVAPSGLTHAPKSPIPTPAQTPTPAPPVAAPPPTSAPAPAAPAIDYTGLAKGYTDYARPQIDKQYQNATDALKVGLAEKGLVGSNLDHQYSDQLGSAYSRQLSGLPGAANTYAHGDTSHGYTPLGDLFTSLVQPIASFNAGNKFTPPPGMAPMPGAGAVGSGASSGGSNVYLSNGNSSRVVN